jgi:sulfite reductase alpha subunit-like flavoprotein
MSLVSSRVRGLTFRQIHHLPTFHNWVLLVRALLPVFALELHQNISVFIMTNSSSSSSSNGNGSNHIYVLYASQTGNSEQAAKDVCHELVSKIPLTTCSHMQLDDFLELQQCAWTPMVIIISSSYGVGQAPLGGYRFRALCDSILLNDDDHDDQHKDMLKGISFSLLGLGDSKYRTYFENPSTIQKAMLKAGATLVGTVGKADASGEQLELISDWIAKLWDPLAKALAQQPKPSPERLLEMQQSTIDICRKNDPDFLPTTTTTESLQINMSMTSFFTLLIVFLAVVVGHFLIKYF